jgi:hypothetical protein
MEPGCRSLAGEQIMAAVPPSHQSKFKLPLFKDGVDSRVYLTEVPRAAPPPGVVETICSEPCPNIAEPLPIAPDPFSTRPPSPWSPDRMRRLIFSLICSSSKAANRLKPTSVGIRL